MKPGISIPQGTSASLVIAVGRISRAYESAFGMLTDEARVAGSRVVNEVYLEQQERLFLREEADVVTDTGLLRKRARGGSAGRYETGNMSDSISATVGGDAMKATRPGVYQGYVGWLPQDYEDYFGEQEYAEDQPYDPALSLLTAVGRIWGEGTEPETGKIADGHFEQAVRDFYRRVTR